MRVAEPLRGSAASLMVASKRSSSPLVLSLAIALSRDRLPAYFLVSLRRRLFFSIELVLAILVSWVSAFEGLKSSLPEREVEGRQQGARLVVGARRGAYGDVHAPDLRRLVVVDLGENDVLLEAERIVAATVEALRVEAAEVPYPRQRDVDQPVDELEHPRLAQRHLAADRLVFAQLVGRDRLARLGDHRPLAGNQRKIARGGFHLLAVGNRLADAHVDDDLVDHRHLHGVLVAELLGELLAPHRVELDTEARRSLRLRRRRLGSLLGLVALGGLLAFVAAVGLAFGLAALGLRLGFLWGLRGFGLTLGLSALGLLGLLVFLISHRSLLPSAWRCAPCGRRRRS